MSRWQLYSLYSALTIAVAVYNLLRDPPDHFDALTIGVLAMVGVQAVWTFVLMALDLRARRRVDRELGR